MSKKIYEHTISGVDTFGIKAKIKEFRKNDRKPRYRKRNG